MRSGEKVWDVDAKVAVAAYYKAQGVSNSEIAALLRVDLSSVSRYLKHAENNAWLEHKLALHLPGDVEREVLASVRAIELERKLFEFFSAEAGEGLEPVRRPGVVVVREQAAESGEPECREVALGTQPPQQDLNAELLNIEGARLLVDILSQYERGERVVLGVSWGRRTGGVVSCLEEMALPELPQLLVVALQGGVGRGLAPERGAQYYPDVLAERIATLFGSRQAPARITLPAFIPSEVARDLGEEGLKAIRRFVDSDQSFQAAASLHQKLDVALVGVGGFEPGAWAVGSGFLSPSDVANLQSAGAVGDIVCRFYRDQPEVSIDGWAPGMEAGDPIREANQRAIGVSLATLHSRVLAGCRVIAVAGGESGAKAAALRAAVRAGLLSDIVTDESTCLAMIAL